MTIQYNPAVADPNLKDLLDMLKKDIMVNLNCHHIATVQEFDAEDQTVTAKVVYSKTFFYRQANGLYKAKLVDYPLIVDAPVIILGGGNATLTFPISKGDDCLVLFNDRDIDNWFAGATSGAVATGALHSFSDALVLVGIPATIQDYDTTRALLRKGAVKIGAGATKILLRNADTTLNTLLGQLITAIKNISVSPGTFLNSGGPVTGAGEVSSSSKSALDTVASAIGGLLE